MYTFLVTILHSLVLNIHTCELYLNIIRYTISIPKIPVKNIYDTKSVNIFGTHCPSLPSLLREREINLTPRNSYLRNQNDLNKPLSKHSNTNETVSTACQAVKPSHTCLKNISEIKFPEFGTIHIGTNKY